MIRTHLLVATGALIAVIVSLASIAPLHAQTPDFNVTSTPVDICVNPGEAASYLVTVSSIGDFRGNVALTGSIDSSATNSPTLSPIPSNVFLTIGQNVTFGLTVSTVQATLGRLYAVTIIGGTQHLVHSTTIYLLVQAACGSVGGTLVPVNNVGLLAPYALIAATVVGAGAGTATLLYNRRTRVR